MKISRIIGFLLAVVLILQSLIQVFIKNLKYVGNNDLVTHKVSTPVIYGAIGLSVIFVLLLLKIKIWKYAFIVLTLSTFTSFVHFSHSALKLSAGNFVIDIIPLSILIVHLIVNPEIYQPSKEERVKIINEQNRLNDEMVLAYMKKLESKSKEELTQIIEGNTHTNEAIIAAKSILEKKREK